MHRLSSVLRALGSFLLLGILVGCGSSHSTPPGTGEPPPTPVPPATRTGSVEIHHILARALPSAVSEYRISGFDRTGQPSLQTRTLDAAPVVVVSDVPVETVFLRVDYLAQGVLVGFFETPLTVEADQTTVIRDPDWIAFNPDAPVFLSAVEYSVGNGPISAAAADFDGDGHLDVATANNGSNSASVIFGNGDGTFSGSTDLATGPSPFGIAAADLNDDGQPDLVVANYGGTDEAGGLSVLLNDGTGSFHPAVQYAVGDGPTSVAVADFNGDGLPDLVCTNFRDGTTSVLLGAGGGSFGAPAFFDGTYRCRAVATGDLNGDGHLDIVLANEGAIGEGDVSVLLGDGTGNFAPGVVYQAGGNPHGVAVGDLNGDGVLDIAVANFTSHNVSVLQGNGNGTFSPSIEYTTGSIPLHLVIGDYNLDGIADLAVVTSGEGRVDLLAGQFGGGFARTVGFPTGQRSFYLAPGDFDEDGIPDLAVANFGSNDVSVLLNGR